MRGRAILLALLVWPAAASAKPKLPPCPPKTAQLYIAPMGEPFRAPADAAYPVAAWFSQADADRDGRLTLKEFAADADRFFARLDVDRDGEITPDELTAYERKMVPEIALYRRSGSRPERREEQRRSRKGEDDYGGPLGAGAFAILNVPQPVASADADLNRGVTRDEFRAAAATRFRLIDKAGQGYLSAATLPPTPAQVSATQCNPTARPEPQRKSE